MVAMDLYDVMRTTGAVRQYTDDPLPDDVLERILDNARFAPSGGNRQGTHVVVVRDPQTRGQLAELSHPRRTPLHRADSQRRRAVESRCSRAGLTRRRSPPSRCRPAHRCCDAPVVLVVCVDLAVVAAFDQDLDRIGVIAGASVYPFVWNILLAARNEGYGGVLTTAAVAEEPRVKELLGIPEDYAIAAVLPLGKPVRQITKLTRKPVAEFASRERFDGEPFSA